MKSKKDAPVFSWTLRSSDLAGATSGSHSLDRLDNLEPVRVFVILDGDLRAIVLALTA